MTTTNWSVERMKSQDLVIQPGCVTMALEGLYQFGLPPMEPGHWTYFLGDPGVCPCGIPLPLHPGWARVWVEPDAVRGVTTRTLICEACARRGTC